MYVNINIFSIFLVLFFADCISGALTAAERRAECENISNLLGPDPACWWTLGMNVWMLDWYNSAVYYKNAPENCHADEAWANCFIRLTLNDTTVSCTGNGTCPYPSTSSKRSLMMQRPDRAKVWYGAYTIWVFHEYISRIHVLLQKRLLRGGYDPNNPTLELNKFLNTEVPWSNDPTFQVLNKRLVNVMEDAWHAGLWTGTDGNSIQSGLLVLLRHQFTDLSQNLSSKAYNFLYTAQDGALLQNWSCLHGIMCKGNETGT
ncbi:MAG: hypothetical protein Q9176_004790 [Flavoplaca citrina]